MMAVKRTESPPGIDFARRTPCLLWRAQSQDRWGSGSLAVNHSKENEADLFPSRKLAPASGRLVSLFPDTARLRDAAPLRVDFPSLRYKRLLISK